MKRSSDGDNALPKRRSPPPLDKTNSSVIEVIDFGINAVLVSFDTAADVARAFGISVDDVERVCAAPLFAELVCGHGLRFEGQNNRTKGNLLGQVNQYDTNGVFMARWRGATAASKMLGIPYVDIHIMCGRNIDLAMSTIIEDLPHFAPMARYIFTWAAHDNNNIICGTAERKQEEEAVPNSNANNPQPRGVTSGYRRRYANPVEILKSGKHFRACDNLTTAAKVLDICWRTARAKLRDGTRIKHFYTLQKLSANEFYKLSTQ